MALRVPLIRRYAEEKWRLAEALASLAAERDDLLQRLRLSQATADAMTEKHKLAINLAEASLRRAIIENDRLRDKLPKAGWTAQPEK
jgi:hypothetical protein